MSTTAPFELRLADGSTLYALQDGLFNPPADILIDPASDDATAKLRAEFPDGLTITVNAFLLRRGDENILIDGGCGTAFGPTLGKVASLLDGIGIKPADITTVLVTHPHGDHILGLLDDAGEALRFPGVDVHCPAIDIEQFSKLASEGENPNRVPARKFFELVGDRLRPFHAGKILPGIEAVSLPGHTPGHSGFLIAGEVLIWADLIHLIHHQPANPDIALVFDEDRALAARTRRETLAMAAEKGLIVGGMHVPAPGLARVHEDGSAFRVELLSA